MELLKIAYEAFNARDIDRALAIMHPDVEWPNGMEGGYVRGRVVRDRAATIVTDRMVQHVDDIDHGLIRRMEIRT